MIEVLLGLPAKVKTLVDRLTSTRATNLDNLDAAVSTRSAASTALSNAVWSDARAGKLDTAALEASPLLSAPIASGLIPTAPTEIVLTDPTSVYTINSGLYHQSTTSASYVDAVNYTGKGVLQFAALQCQQSTSSSATATMQITIDGVVIQAPTVPAHSNNSYAKIIAIVGVITTGSLVSLDSIPFKTSLRIEYKTTSPGTARSFVKYRKTA